MSTAVEFPDLVSWATTYLAAALTANGYPQARVADTYRGDKVEVWLQRDGGAVIDQTREVARLRVNCFHEGKTDDNVDTLAQRVSTLLRVAADGAPVVRVRQLTGPTNIPDVRPRRYMLFELTVRGHSVSLA